MSTKNKMLQASAGNAGGAGLDITDVFSTYLYTGNGSTQTITNDIDLAGEGGMTWIKSRSAATDHQLFDTVRGATKELMSNAASPEATDTNTLTAFNSDGFSLGADATTNTSAATYASWTFRKAPKFFDVVTWVGNGASSRQIPHNLGAKPGAIFVKVYSHGQDWSVYHRNLEILNYLNQPQNLELRLNTTGATVYDLTAWAGTEPTDTHFTVGTQNNNGYPLSYVAYVFAHNDGDGEFGPDSDQDIIKCGSYTGNGSTNGPVIDLGFEPQWLIVKNSTQSGEWQMFDAMRGFTSGEGDAVLRTQVANAEYSQRFISPTSTGFKIPVSDAPVNGTNNRYIYIAIRRGPLAPPESGTEVFDVVTRTDSGSNTQHTVGFAPDVVLDMSRPAYSFNFVYDRLRGGTKYLAPNATNAEGTFDYITFNDETGKFTTKTQTSGGITFVDYAWKRAPSFFDVVAYTGTGKTTQTKQHNLGAVPEMIWVKRRDGISQWPVYHKDIGFSNTLVLDSISGQQPASAYWKATPTDTEFYVGTAIGTSGGTYIAYLFASLDGISKVGSYTGNGSSQNIDCGFTSGARFVLIKRTDNSGSWWVFDTERGIVSGNDPALQLNNTSDEISVDWIDPYSSGFKVASSFSEINASGGEYIFYAIA